MTCSGRFGGTGEDLNVDMWVICVCANTFENTTIDHMDIFMQHWYYVGCGGYGLII